MLELSDDIGQAFEQIDSYMINEFKDYQIKRCKRRLCKLLDARQRKQKCADNAIGVLVTEKKKQRRREAKRELKALRAAKIVSELGNELLNRLKAGYYGNLYTETQQESEKETSDTEYPDIMEDLDMNTETVVE